MRRPPYLSPLVGVSLVGALGIGLAGVSACAPLEGPLTVEAVLPLPGGGSTVGDVVLQTVEDLNTGRGQAFDVRGNLRVSLNDINDLSNASFDDMLTIVREDDGDDVEPHYSFDGQRYVADDFETLFYFSMFANFEAAIEEARGFGDTSRATSNDADEKAIAGLFASVILNDFLPLPLLTADNAAFLPPLDGWLALRQATQDGTPFAMHRGVAAHEFGHRLFFHNVFRTDAAFDVWRAGAFAESLNEDELRAQMLLKGVDEGLADIFAIAALADDKTLDGAFRTAGGVFVDEADRRDLDGRFANEATWDNLRELSLDTDLLQLCGLTREEFKVNFNFYCVGTVLATALWDGAGGDIAVLRDDVEPAIIRALPQVGQAIGDAGSFDMHLLLAPIFAELPAERQARMCASFGDRFESIVVAGQIPGCAR